jgi:hypothetical protein
MGPGLCRDGSSMGHPGAGLARMTRRVPFDAMNFWFRTPDPEPFIRSVVDFMADDRSVVALSKQNRRQPRIDSSKGAEAPLRSSSSIVVRLASPGSPGWRRRGARARSGAARRRCGRRAAALDALQLLLVQLIRHPIASAAAPMGHMMHGCMMRRRMMRRLRPRLGRRWRCRGSRWRRGGRGRRGW